MVGRHARQFWIFGMLCLPLQPAFGEDYADAGANRPSREDARDLAVLAPRSRPSTAAATYGDAPVAPPPRERRRFGDATREPSADAPVGLYFCPGRTTHIARHTARRLCAHDPRRAGFRQSYVYTPAYATSPQVPRDGRGRESSLFPPATQFFYSATTRLFANPRDE